MQKKGIKRIIIVVLLVVSIVSQAVLIKKANDLNTDIDFLASDIYHRGEVYSVQQREILNEVRDMYGD